MTELSYKFKLDTVPTGMAAKEGDILKVDSIKFSGGAQISYDNFLACCTESNHYEPFERELEESRLAERKLKEEIALLKAGKKVPSTRKPSKRLSIKEIEEVDELLGEGVANIVIAEKFKVSASAISRRKGHLESLADTPAMNEYAESLGN